VREWMTVDEIERETSMLEVLLKERMTVARLRSRCPSLAVHPLQDSGVCRLYSLLIHRHELEADSDEGGPNISRGRSDPHVKAKEWVTVDTRERGIRRPKCCSERVAGRRSKCC
jgi:hypothetical protein